jgi:hypothetical protein
MGVRKMEAVDEGEMRWRPINFQLSIQEAIEEKEMVIITPKLVSSRLPDKAVIRLHNAENRCTILNYRLSCLKQESWNNGRQIT